MRLKQWRWALPAITWLFFGTTVHGQQLPPAFIADQNNNSMFLSEFFAYINNKLDNTINLDLRYVSGFDAAADKLFGTAPALAVVTSDAIRSSRHSTTNPSAARYLARIDTVKALLVTTARTPELSPGTTITVSVWPRAFGEDTLNGIATPLGMKWELAPWRDDAPLQDVDAVLVVGPIPPALTQAIGNKDAKVSPLTGGDLGNHYHFTAATSSDYPDAITPGTLIETIEIDIVLATNVNSTSQSLKRLLMTLFSKLDRVQRALWVNASPCATVPGWVRHKEVDNLQTQDAIPRCDGLPVPWPRPQ